MHYFELDFGPMTLVLKLDIDMVVIYLHAKKYGRSIGQAVQKLSSGYTHRQTDTVKPLSTRIHGQ